MRPRHFAPVFLRLGLSIFSLPCACAPRPPAGCGQDSSATVSPSPTPPAADGNQQAAHLDSDGVRQNPWSDAARDVLTPHCGQCHRGDLPTAVPGALAVFDLLENPWYGRLASKQFDGILMRVRGTKAIEAGDASLVEQFVRCARDGACEAQEK